MIVEWMKGFRRADTDEYSFNHSVNVATLSLLLASPSRPVVVFASRQHPSRGERRIERDQVDRAACRGVKEHRNAHRPDDLHQRCADDDVEAATGKRRHIRHDGVGRREIDGDIYPRRFRPLLRVDAVLAEDDFPGHLRVADAEPLLPVHQRAPNRVHVHGPGTGR